MPTVQTETQLGQQTLQQTPEVLEADKVRCRYIEVTDSAGRVRAEVGCDGEGVAVTLWSRDHQASVTLGVGDCLKGGDLHMRFTSGKLPAGFDLSIGVWHGGDIEFSADRPDMTTRNLLPAGRV